MPSHPLHQSIGCVLDGVHQSLPDDLRRDCVLIKDPACVSGPSPAYVRVPQNIPLFCSAVRSNPTEYCNVDALVLLGGGIKVILEIKESAPGPTRFSASSSSPPPRTAISTTRTGPRRSSKRSGCCSCRSWTLQT